MSSEEVGRCDPLLRFQNRKILPGRLGVHGVIHLDVYGFFVKFMVGERRLLIRSPSAPGIEIRRCRHV